MGFFFWFLCTILVVALVLLLFPFSVRIDFEAGERGARALFFFFKKKVYEYEKKWGKDETKDDKCVDRESRPSSLGHDRDQHLGQERSDCPKTKDGEGEGKETKDDSDGDVILEPKAIESTKTDLAEVAKPATSCHPERTLERSDRGKSKDLECLDEGRKTIDDRGDDVVVEAKAPAASREELKTVPAESKVDEAKKDKPKVLASKPIEVKSSDARRETSDERQEEKDESGDDAIQEPKNQDSSKSAKPKSEKKEKPKKEKPKLTDREFWTIVLTPDLDARAFKYVLKIIAAVFSLFRIRFSDCFVEGIRSDYVTMGYIAAVNGVMKAYPYVGAWDLRMDWCHEKELRAAGNVRLSITLLRIFCFVLETLVLAGILAFIFWRRRAHVLKTKELPEIGFIRKKIVDLILED